MRNVILNVLQEYRIPGASYRNLTHKCTQITCCNGNKYLIKECNLYADARYNFLYGQNVSNVLYPLKNTDNKFITKANDRTYYILPYVDNFNVRDETKTNKLSSELNKLHINTTFRRELSPQTTRKKLEEIYNYLQYKFDAIEGFVRTVEARPYDEYSILILKEYHNILDSKKIMGKLNKKLVEHIKVRKTVDFSFVHNNPKLDHLLCSSDADFLISIEKGKIGIPILDIVKFYIESEDIQIDRKEIVNEYFMKYNDDFYFDYFCFFVMLYYIKGIIIIDKDYVSSQSFVYAGSKLKQFITDFNLI